VEPIAIRFVKDRKGKIIFEPEKEALTRQQQAGDALQLMTPQTAYIMVDILKSTVEWGTLSGAHSKYLSNSPHEFAGKTGTTQNWHDAWTIGFSAQITTAIWFGFDKGGHSLGTLNTGASVAAPVWGQFMNEIHKNLPVKQFSQPGGLTKTTICRKSGLFPSGDCETEDLREELFLIGTEPHAVCDVCKFRKERRDRIIVTLQEDLSLHEHLGPGDFLDDLMPEDYPVDETPPSLDDFDIEDLLNDDEDEDSDKPSLDTEAVLPEDSGNYLLLDE